MLTLPDDPLCRLPRVQCDGTVAPWDQLAQSLRMYCAAAVHLHWVGLWQDTALDVVEFVFATTLTEVVLTGGAEWSSAQNSALIGQDVGYVSRVKTRHTLDDVWTIDHDPAREYVDAITLDESTQDGDVG